MVDSGMTCSLIKLVRATSFEDSTQTMSLFEEDCTLISWVNIENSHDLSKSKWL